MSFLAKMIFDLTYVGRFGICPGVIVDICLIFFILRDPRDVTRGGGVGSRGASGVITDVTSSRF